MIKNPDVIKRAFFDGPEGQVHYRFGGSGEPLLLLHQTPRSSDSTFGDALPALAMKHFVIAMDTPGYGDSFKPTRSYSMKDFAETVVLLLDSLNIKHASILGHHTGSFIAIETAAQYPDRVENLILSYPLPLIDEEERNIAHSLLQSGDPYKMREDGSHLLEMWQRFQTQMIPTGPLELLNRYVMDRMKAGHTSDPHFALRAVFSYPMEKRLPLIQCPTLIIWGIADLEREDRELGFHIKQKRHIVNELISRSKTIEFTGPNSTSAMTSLMLDKFVESVLQFLESTAL